METISTVPFSPEAQKTIDRAETWQRKLVVPMSPRLIVLGLLNSPLKEAFGDKDTRRHIRNALVRWERGPQRPDMEELERFYVMASLRAKELHPQTGINNLDLVYAALNPEGELPIDPFPYISGDQPYPLLYRERVYITAGGAMRNAHYGTEAYRILRQSEIKGATRGQVLPFRVQAPLEMAS